MALHSAIDVIDPILEHLKFVLPRITQKAPHKEPTDTLLLDNLGFEPLPLARSKVSAMVEVNHLVSVILEVFECRMSDSLDI